MAAEDGDVLPPGRTQLDLIQAQVEAIDAWHRARRLSEAAADVSLLSREMRLDLSRRMDARRREQEALLRRAEQQLRESGGALSSRAGIRVVLAHRNAWLRDSVARRLAERGARVVGVFEDGADAAGTIVVEQPDLVLVEDRLPTVSGLELVQRVREFSPETVVGAQCPDVEGVKVLIDAGAQAVFTRRVPPVEIADELVRCLATGGQPVAVG